MSVMAYLFLVHYTQININTQIFCYIGNIHLVFTMNYSTNNIRKLFDLTSLPVDNKHSRIPRQDDEANI